MHKHLEKYNYLRNYKKIILPLLISIGLVIRASFFLRRRDPNAFATVDTSNSIAILLIFLALPFIVSKRGLQGIKILWDSPIKLYILYLVWCLVSVLWATNIIFSIYKVVELLVTLFLISYIFVSLSNSVAAKKIIILYFLISILAGIGYYFKIYGFSLSYFHTNSYSMVAAAGIIIGYYFYRNRNNSEYPFSQNKLLAVVLLAVSIFAVVVGTSSASNLSLLFAVVFLISFKKNNLASILLLICAFAILWFLWSTYQTELMSVLFPGKTMKSIETGTGRVGMWQHYLNGFLQRPLLGYGFPSGEKEAYRFGWMITSSSHNMIISVAINTGIIGLLLFLAFLTKYYLHIVRGLKAGYYDFKWIVGVWIVLIINSLSLPALGSGWSWMTSSFFCVMVYSVVYYK